MRTIVLYVPALSPGGAERVMVNLANQMSTFNYLNVYLMAQYEGLYVSMVNEKVKRIDLRNTSFFKMYGVIRKIKPDVILSTVDTANVKSVFMKFLMPRGTLFITRAPNIYYSWRYKKGFMSRLVTFLLKYAYQFSDGVISNSPDTEKSLLSVGINNVIKTVGNPVFSWSEIDTTVDKPFDVVTPYIVYVGSFKTQKRIDLLLKTFLIVSNSFDVNLVIVGDGDQDNNKEKALSFIKDNNLEEKVLFVGRKSQLSGYYKYAKCFVLCSEYEGFGNVIVESLANGTPVVCFDCPGGPNYILENGRYGTLANFGDTEKLARSILDLLNQKLEFDPRELKERADDFSIENVSRKYIEYISSLYINKFNETF